MDSSRESPGLDTWRMGSAQVGNAQAESEAPEVAPSSQPMHVERGSEGLQAYDSSHWQNQQQQYGHISETKPPVSGGTPTTSPPHPQFKGYSAHEPNVEENQRPPRSRKATWLPAIIVGVCALLIGLGAGIGIGFAVGENENKGSSSSSSPGPSPSTSPTSTIGTSPSSTPSTNPGSSFPTSGYTGVAAFSCNNTATYSASINSMIFQQECGVAYISGAPTWNATNSDPAVSERVGIATVYSFQECMDQCAFYNIWNVTSPVTCQAVTYEANLTYNIATYGGNCFLRNVRAVDYSQDPNQNYSTTASAYWFPEDTS